MYNVSKNGVDLGLNVENADTFFTRFKGLMFRKSIDKNYGLFIKPCSQVHTFNMRFDIDVLFLSKSCEVLHIEHSMKPCKCSKNVKNAQSVLEVTAGWCLENSIAQGDVLNFG